MRYRLSLGPGAITGRKPLASSCLRNGSIVDTGIAANCRYISPGRGLTMFHCGEAVECFGFSGCAGALAGFAETTGWPSDETRITTGAARRVVFALTIRLPTYKQEKVNPMTT